MKPMRQVGVSGKVMKPPMVAESSRGFPLPITEKIFSKVLTRRKPISIIGRKKEKGNKMTTLILMVVGKKYKVYKDMGNGKRRLMGSFNSSTEAERFMNA
jgi:hypothetical protein